MAQIPVIERTPEQNPQSVGRIEAPQINVQQPYAHQDAAFQRLGNAGLHYYAAQVKSTAEVEGLRAANEYHTVLEKKLEGDPENNIIGARHQMGDPTDIYKQYDSDAQSAYDNIVNRYADASDETKAAVSSKLATVNQHFNDRKSVAFATQKTQYTTSIADSNVKLAQNDMTHIADIDPTDPKSVIPIAQKIDEITSARITEGMANGSITEKLDPNGEIDPVTGQIRVVGHVMNSAMRVKIGKDVSDGLNRTLQTLIAAGDVQSADYLSKHFDNYLDAYIKPTIKEHIQKAEKEQEASDVFMKVKAMPSDKAFAEIDKAMNSDPAVGQKAAAMYDTYTRRMHQAQERTQTDYHNKIGQIILNRERDGNPFVDVNDMESDPAIKQLIDKISPKQVKALRQMVEQPTNSDPDQLAAAYDATFNGKLEKMPPDEFNQLIAGLNKEDRNRFKSKYMMFNTPTDAQDARNLRVAGTQLTKELQNVGYVKKDTYNKYSNKDQIKLNQANSQLQDAIQSLGPNPSAKAIQETVTKLATDIKKSEIKPKSWWQSLFGSDTTPATSAPSTSTTPTPAEKAKPVIQDSATEYEARKEFYRQTRRTPSPAELDKFIKNGNKL